MSNAPNTDANDRLFGEAKEDRVWPNRHVVSDRVNREFLDGANTTADQLATVERLRHAHPERWANIVGACSDTATRGVLAGLTSEDGTATYDALSGYVPASRRTVRRRVYDLRDEDILRVEDGHPAVVMFVDESAAILTEDALSIFYGV